ncbi:alpha-ribazole phosphatase [Desulfosporosinus acididurans]|uniref:Alpha-ribazole phosphatase n=1 Tax=Desulfosporosinus acididurans TaxID=476652 RepID=A0A0J1FMM4_9FIRM|nr:alpha-ribazole phosphatase [Desulfosporosinus acididurans]KLU64223.1 alpha-ribazole phosphatase [Desulfosporosinus acididurans]
MKQKLIYLVRHGDIGLGSEKRYIGQTDLPLSPLGLKQASLLKDMFSHLSFDNIFCSDLMRAQQTAEIIAILSTAVPILCPEFREVNMGDWEGKTFSEIRTRFPKKFAERGQTIANFVPPRGESFSDCSKRVLPAFERLAESAGNTILIVAHAGVNRIIICHVLGMPLENVFQLQQSYGCVNLLCQDSSGYRLNYMNNLVVKVTGEGLIY